MEMNPYKAPKATMLERPSVSHGSILHWVIWPALIGGIAAPFVLPSHGGPLLLDIKFAMGGLAGLVLGIPARMLIAIWSVLSVSTSTDNRP